MIKKLLNHLPILAVFVVVFLTYVVVAEGSIESDAQISVNAAYNFVRGNGFSLSPPEYNQGIQVVIGKDGKYYSGTGLVGNMLYVPAALVSKYIHETRHDAPTPLFPLQSDYLLTFLASFVNPIFGFLLFVVNYKIFRWFLTKKQSLLLSLIISFSTNLLPLSKQALYHIPYLFFLMLSFYFLLSFLRTNKKINLLLSGIVMGISLVTYNVTGFLMAAILGVFLLLSVASKTKDVKKTIISIMIFGISAVPGLISFLWFNYVRFGNILNSGYDPNSYDLVTKGNLYDGLWGLLFSPGKSIFLYSPVLVLVAWVAIKKIKDCDFSKLFIAISLIWLLFYGRLVFWHGDLCWGPRYMLPIIPFGGLVLAVNWKEFNKWVCVLLVGFGLFVQLEGVVIAYQIQYGPYDSKIINQKIGNDRGSVFEYWGLGTYIPRYSPVNRFKREVFARLFAIKSIFTEVNDLEIVGGMSMAMPRDGRFFRHGLSTFVMYAFNDVNVGSFGMELLQVNQPLKTLKFCFDGICTTSTKVTKSGNYYLADFGKPISIKSGKYVTVVLNDGLLKKVKNDFEFDVYRMDINSVEIDLRTYRKINTDIAFVGSYPLIPDYTNLSTLWRIRGDVQELVNITPDFWWIKTQIYFNLPWLFRELIYFVIGGWVLSIIVATYYFLHNDNHDASEPLSDSGSTVTYDYYHKNTFWNDHYLVRKYMNKLATDDESVDWLHYTFDKYYKSRKPISVLSVGCGNGWQDRWIDELFKFKKLDGYDISDELLKEAKDKASSSRYRYFKADLNKDEIGDGKYDLVVNLAALHHVENMEHLLLQVKKHLKTNGLFLSFDYVGPFRNQYSDTDLKYMNWMQRKISTDLVGRDKIVKPDINQMLKEDPSEAVGSELVVPGIKKIFKIIRLRYLNGGMLYQVLYNHIQNFRQGDVDHDNIIRKMLAIEQKMTKDKKVRPFFAFIVAKLK